MVVTQKKAARHCPGGLVVVGRSLSTYHARGGYVCFPTKLVCAKPPPRGIRKLRDVV
jgi:hypothetical protein